MAASRTISGGLIKLYINNKLYKEVQSISFSVSYNETPIYGIDSVYAQELAPGRVEVSGTLSGIRIKMSGGLQGSSMRPLFQDVAASPYISIRIQNRLDSEDIIFIPNAKVTREDHSVAIKGVYRMNISFVGSVPQFALDRA